MKQPIIFCDFDGTITESDNIIAIMKHFAPPPWEALKDGVLTETISIREGVSQMFSLLPSNIKHEIIQYVLDIATIRSGFTDFVTYTKKQNIPLYVVTGGIDFFIYPILDEFIKKENIYCNQSDFSRETIQILWPHVCDEHCSNDCGCCKPSILRKFPDEHVEKIVIGDSITDLQAAKLADRVFARDYLIEKCKEQHISYTPFESFTDILQELQGIGTR
jgi:2-hydroxy-3-keto-5-methylthiopentenyl-1-phosphate phosphatase